MRLVSGGAELRFAAVLSDMDAEIEALESDRTKYERIKYGMMPGAANRQDEAAEG